MSQASLSIEPPMLAPEFLQYLNDAEFDSVFPPELQALSQVHWTPVSVARRAAKFLVTDERTRVLDIGCGPGKFCAIGASATEGQFTGVEQRAHLITAAERMVRRYHLSRVQFIHANMQEVSFGDFDAYYLFNPFHEVLLRQAVGDAQDDANERLYAAYNAHVRQELEKRPLATRVATYWCDGDEIPDSYDCVSTAFSGSLRMWVRTRGVP